MDRFRSNDMPMSVAVLDIDWHLMKIPEEYGTAWTGYTWDKELFPDHVTFLEELRKRKLKTTLNVHPADGVRAYEKPYAAMCKAMSRDASKGVPVPFECADKKFFAEYFKQLHHPLEDEGVDFWWIDWQQGPHSEVETVDPLWMLNHYHFIDSGRKGERRFTFSRYAGPGSHRYPVGFSAVSRGARQSAAELNGRTRSFHGRVLSFSRSLPRPRAILATASGAMILAGTITGSRWVSRKPSKGATDSQDDELMARWVQLRCFSPILRLHSSISPFNTREPWDFSRECQDVSRAFLQLRHRLVPYLYSEAAHATTTYKSLVEPIYYDYPASSEAYAYKTQFSFGTELIVFPIVAPITKSVALGKAMGWLPPGRWVDVFDETVYDGDRVLSFHRALDGYPVLAKEGAIVPLDGKTGGAIENGCPIPETIEILLVVGKDGKFVLLEDDGKGADVSSVKFSTTPICYSLAEATLSIGPTEHPLLEKRTYAVRLLACAPTDITVEVDGAVIVPPPSVNVGLVNLGTHSSSSTITLTLASCTGDRSTLVLRKSDLQPRIFDRLAGAQMSIDIKGAIWDAVKRLDEEGVVKVISRIKAVGADEAILAMVEELLLADLS